MVGCDIEFGSDSDHGDSRTVAPARGRSLYKAAPFGRGCRRVFVMLSVRVLSDCFVSFVGALGVVVSWLCGFLCAGFGLVRLASVRLGRFRIVFVA